MATDAILIEDIEEELMKYPPQKAWEYLCQLNQSPILNGIQAWHDAYPALQEKYRDRMTENEYQLKELADAIMKMASRPTYSYNYAAGATHDDKRHQLNLGEERKSTLLQKNNDNP